MDAPLLLLLFIQATLICTSYSEQFRKAEDSSSCAKRDDCKISLPQKVKTSCLEKRNASQLAAKQWYRLAIHPEFELSMPSLDQSQLHTAIKARFDQEDAKWFSVYYSMIGLLNDTASALIAKGVTQKPMTTYDEYRELFEIFRSVIKKIPAPHFFSQPYDVTTFTNIVADNKWRNDKYFVQRRLAAQCAYYIRKVTKETNPKKVTGMSKGYLKGLLNPSFQWTQRLTEMHKATITLDEAVDAGILYVLHHEEFNGIPTTRDIMDLNPYDEHVALDNASPVTVFLLVRGNLEVVAIQVNYTQDSQVVTPKGANNPEDDFEWLKAKGLVDIVDMAVCQLDGHLVQTHKTEEIICNLYKRHFSVYHPLYHILLHHCEGTTPVGALGITALINEERYMHRLFRFGHTGTRFLINEYYKKKTYADADLEYILKKQGLDNDDIKYYPFRDDGRIIWKEINAFAKKYVKLYYKNKNDVQNDYELQNFVREVATVGDYRGFPSSFKKQSDVSTFISRFIWLPVLHAANSYPLYPNGAYLPIAPTKLYSDPQPEAQGKYPYSLPNAAVVLTQEVLTFTLSSLRINRLFDYGLKLPDRKGSNLVLKTFQKLNTCIQKQLESLNAKRHKKGDLTYQYMEPRWLPNSIHC